MRNVNSTKGVLPVQHEPPVHKSLMPAALLQRGGEIISYSRRLQMLHLSLLMAGVTATDASTAGDASQCPFDKLSIQITNTTWSGPETTLAAARMPTDPHFRAFVTTVTEHVAARLAKDQHCIDNADSKKRSLLQFIAWPLVTAGDGPPDEVPSLGAWPTGGCRITSPWIDIAFERKPVPWIRGVVRWNERQLLADQAVLAGARNVPAGVAMPLKQGEFWYGAAQDYANSEIFRVPAVKPIEERVPPDLLWLFRRSPHITFTPFGDHALDTMRIAMEKNAGHYTQLVIALIDHCFASDGAAIHYNNILDVVDLISLEEYKISMPIRTKALHKGSK